MSWRRCLSVSVGLAFAGAAATTALAEDGVPQEQLNRQGLETTSQSRKGYKALNEAVFALLFDEERPVNILFGRDNPRGVTGFDAPSQAATNWAISRYFEYWAEQQFEQATQENVTSTDAGNSTPKQNTSNDTPQSNDSGPLYPRLSIQTSASDAVQRAAVIAWAKERGFSIRAVKMYFPELFDDTEIAENASEEETESTVFGRILGGAVEAVEEATDTKIVFESGSGEDEDTTKWSPGFRISAGYKLWDEEWKEVDWAQDFGDYDSALDATIGWSKVPRWHITFAPDYAAAYTAYEAQAATDAVAGNEAGAGDPPTLGSPDWLEGEWMWQWGDPRLKPMFTFPSDTLFGDRPSDNPADNFQTEIRFHARF